jgi:hypothetical protein
MKDPDAGQHPEDREGNQAKRHWQKSSRTGKNQCRTHEAEGKEQNGKPPGQVARSGELHAAMARHIHKAWCVFTGTS